MIPTWSELIGNDDGDEQHQLPSAWSLLTTQWEYTRVNLATFSYLIAIPVVMLCLAVSIADTHAVLSKTSGGNIIFDFSWLLLLVTLFMAAITIPALSYVRLASVRRKKVSYRGALRQGLALFYKWWVLQILLVFSVCLGLVFLLLPGFYILRRYMLARYVLVDQNTTVGQALRESARLTKSYDRAMWSTVSLLALSPIAFGILPSELGLLVVITLFMWNLCGTALRYEQILNKEYPALQPKTKKKHSSGKRNHRVKKRS